MGPETLPHNSGSGWIKLNAALLIGHDKMLLLVFKSCFLWNYSLGGRVWWQLYTAQQISKGDDICCAIFEAGGHLADLPAAIWCSICVVPSACCSLLSADVSPSCHCCCSKLLLKAAAQVGKKRQRGVSNVSVFTAAWCP